MTRIYLMEQAGFTAESFEKAIEELGLIKKLQDSEKIIIKPNLTTIETEDGCMGRTTPLWLIETILAGIRRCNRNAKILIVESDSGNKNRARDKFSRHGLHALENMDENLILYNLTENKILTSEFHGSYFREYIEMPAILQEDYFYLSLAKVKTHRLTTYTGILKNQFGCLPMTDKTSFHPDLDRVIADVNAFVRPTLSILEACPGMEGNGPIHGKDRNLGILALSDNPVELDSFFAKATGLDQYKIKHIHQCRKQLQGLYAGGPVTVIHEDIMEPIQNFEYIPSRKRIKIQLGLLVQKFGQKIIRIGKRMQRK